MFALRGLLHFSFPILLTWLAQGGVELTIPAVLAACAGSFGIAFHSKDSTERRLFTSLGLALVPIFALLALRGGFATIPPITGEFTWTALLITCVFPGVLLIYFALKHNFLDYGAQRNLVYALSAMFLALLYLAFVRRVSGWLEPALPSEATASILLFVADFFV